MKTAPMRMMCAIFASFVFFVTFASSSRAAVEEIWRDDFRDNVPDEYLGDPYWYGWGSFDPATESGGMLKVVNPTSYNMYFWIDTGKTEKYFPAGTTLKARIRINSSRVPGAWGDRMLADTESYYTTFPNNTWTTVSFQPTTEYSDVGFGFSWEDGTWNNSTDSIEVDWISVSGDPDSYTGGEYLWTKKIGDSPWQEKVNFNHTKTTSDGTTVMAGWQAGGSTVDYDPGPGTLNRTAASNGSALTAKYDTSGDVVWANVIGGTGYVYSRVVGVNTSGDVYMSGLFSGTIDFDPGAGTDSRTGAIPGEQYTYLTKYNSNGSYAWTQIVQGTRVRAEELPTDSSGGVLLVGSFDVTADFDPGAGVDSINPYGYGAFVSKYTAAGSYQWTRAYHGLSWAQTGNIEAVGGAVDASDNIYVSGTWRDTVDFNPGAGTDIRTMSPYGIMYLTKLDSSGGYQWTNTIGNSSVGVYPYAIAVDGSGNAYVDGNFSGLTDFDPSANTHEIGGSGGSYFIAKYDSSGSYQWVYDLETVTGNLADMVEYNLSMDIANTGVIVSSRNHIFKISTAGSLVWTQPIVVEKDDYTYAAAVDTSGNLYVTGNTAFPPADFWVGYPGTDREESYYVAFRTKYGPAGGVTDWGGGPECGIACNDDGGGGGGGGENGGGGGTNLDGSKYSYNYYPVNLDINATIAIACDTSVAMNAIVGTGKSVITLSGNKATNNSAMCNIKTNASSGYKIEWNSSATHEASGALKSTTNALDTISGYTLSASSETWSIDATASEWGAKLGASSEGYGTGNGGGDYSYASAGGWGTGDDYIGGKWMNVPTTSFQIMQKSTETDVDGEYQYLVFGAEIGADKLQPTGTYTQEVTVTATTL